MLAPLGGCADELAPELAPLDVLVELVAFAIADPPRASAASAPNAASPFVVRSNIL
jgi:hypothetical protein